MRRVLQVQRTLDEAGLARIFLAHHRDGHFGETTSGILSIETMLAGDSPILVVPIVPRR